MYSQYVSNLIYIHFLNLTITTSQQQNNYEQLARDTIWINQMTIFHIKRYFYVHTQS